MTVQEALHIYRSKELIEKSCGNYKDRLNGCRLLVSSKKSFNGKIFVQFATPGHSSKVREVRADQVAICDSFG